MNHCKSDVLILPKRGNRFSLSQGERAGVRAGFFILTSLLEFMVRGHLFFWSMVFTRQHVP
jgi:hypothetical protein